MEDYNLASPRAENAVTGIQKFAASYKLTVSVLAGATPQEDVELKYLHG
jgi:hypothetical protein